MQQKWIAVIAVIVIIVAIVIIWKTVAKTAPKKAAGPEPSGPLFTPQQYQQGMSAGARGPAAAAGGQPEPEKPEGQ